jgi:hypothetical protein
MAASTQSCPGTIQLANALASGIAAESVAFAKMGQSLNTYSNTMSTHAQDEQVQGEKMTQAAQILTTIQWVTGILSVVTFGIGGVVGLGVSGLTSTVAATISPLVDVGVSVTQGILGATQGGMQAYKSDIQSTTERDSTAVAALGKNSDVSSDAIKSESQGAGTLGSAINTMLINEGSIERQKITK